MSKVSFLRCIKGPCLMLLMFFSTAYANLQTTALPWVIDEQELFSIKETSGIAHILSASAANRDIHVRVLLVNIESDSAAELIHQKVIEYKNRIPLFLKEKTTFLIINLATLESKILLGKEIQRTEPMLQSLGRIQNGIILPALAQEDVKSAITQGAIAIATVLDTSPVMQHTTSLWQLAKTWLSKHALLLPVQILFWLSLIVGAWYGSYRYLKHSTFNPQDGDMDGLQEIMIQNSIALRQQYGDDCESHRYS